MFELPEYVTLTKQCNQTIKGKVIQRGNLGNLPNKFVWYNCQQPLLDFVERGERE